LSEELEQRVGDNTHENIRSRRDVQHSQERCMDSVDRAGFCEPAVNLLLSVEGGDFFYRAYWKPVEWIWTEEPDLKGVGLPGVRKSRRRSLERGRRPLGKSSSNIPFANVLFKKGSWYLRAL
jgi:hypothetical protein